MARRRSPKGEAHASFDRGWAGIGRATPAQSPIAGIFEAPPYAKGEVDLPFRLPAAALGTMAGASSIFHLHCQERLKQMKIVVAGGTGQIGRKVVRQLEAGGHDVVAAARATGVNIATGEGLETVLSGADVVIDVSNSGYFEAAEMQRFFENAGTTLLAAERRHDIRHHIALSAVGADQLSSGYFRAKKTQEDLVVASGLPFTIVRSTPFFEYLYKIVDQGGDGDTLTLPPVPLQPIAGEDVARALVRVALAGPSNEIVEVAGPDAYLLPAVAEEILTANEDCRAVAVDPKALYFGAQMNGAALIGGDHPRFAPTSLDDWLRHAIEAA